VFEDFLGMILVVLLILPSLFIIPMVIFFDNPIVELLGRVLNLSNPFNIQQTNLKKEKRRKRFSTKRKNSKLFPII